MRTNRGSWTEVLELDSSETVAIFSAEPDSISSRLQHRVGSLTILSNLEEALRRSESPAIARTAIASPSGAALPGASLIGGDDRGATEIDLRADSGQLWDVLILDGPEPTVDLGACWATVRPGGRIVLISDNPRSPLRQLDRLKGNDSGVAVANHKELVERLAAAGCGEVRTLGLLRSSQSSPTVFRTDLPKIGQIVLSSALLNSGRVRRTAIRTLRAFASRGRASALVPAWMIVATDRDTSDSPSTPVGRIGVEHNDRGAVVLGPGPDAVEKSYPSISVLEATKDALDALEAAGFGLAPRVVSQPPGLRLQLSWSHGIDIDGWGMNPDELAVWLDRAGFVLGTMHRLTHRPSDNSVLVHGDYWLGALLRKDDEISGVIDWDHCRRGDAMHDRRTLAEIATRHDGVTPVISQGLIAAADAGYERGRANF